MNSNSNRTCIPRTHPHQHPHSLPHPHLYPHPHPHPYPYPHPNPQMQPHKQPRPHPHPHPHPHSHPHPSPASLPTVLPAAKAISTVSSNVVLIDKNRSNHIDSPSDFRCSLRVGDNTHTDKPTPTIIRRPSSSKVLTKRNISNHHCCPQIGAHVPTDIPTATAKRSSISTSVLIKSKRSKCLSRVRFKRKRSMQSTHTRATRAYLSSSSPVRPKRRKFHRKKLSNASNFLGLEVKADSEELLAEPLNQKSDPCSPHATNTPTRRVEPTHTTEPTTAKSNSNRTCIPRTEASLPTVLQAAKAIRTVSSSVVLIDKNRSNHIDSPSDFRCSFRVGDNTLTDRPTPTVIRRPSFTKALTKRKTSNLLCSTQIGAHLPNDIPTATAKISSISTNALINMKRSKCLSSHRVGANVITDPPTDAAIRSSSSTKVRIKRKRSKQSTHNRATRVYLSSSSPVCRKRRKFHRKNLSNASNFVGLEVKADSEETSSVDVPSSDDYTDITNLIADDTDTFFDQPTLTDLPIASSVSRIGSRQTATEIRNSSSTNVLIKRKGLNRRSSPRVGANTPTVTPTATAIRSSSSTKNLKRKRFNRLCNPQIRARDAIGTEISTTTAIKRSSSKKTLIKRKIFNHPCSPRVAANTSTNTATAPGISSSSYTKVVTKRKRSFPSTDNRAAKTNFSSSSPVRRKRRKIHRKNLFDVKNFLDLEVKVDSEEISSVELHRCDDYTDISNFIADDQDTSFDQPRFTHFPNASPVTRIGRINTNDWAKRYL